MRKLLVVGQGNLGAPLAHHLSQNYQTWGLSRTAPASDDESLVTPLLADLLTMSSLTSCLKHHFDYIVYCVAPKVRSDSAYKETYVLGLTHLLACLKEQNILPERLFFISSTSVYHQCQGEWVDENSSVLPTTYSGKHLLDAENIALSADFPTTIIRFSGIYGRHRLRLIQQALVEPDGFLSANPIYSNRIHQEDCIGFIEHLINNAGMKNEADKACYIGSDSAPAPIQEVRAFIRRAVRNRIEVMADERFSAFSAHKRSKLNNAQLQTKSGSKRCNNKHLLDSGYVLQYPGYQQGYGEIIKQMDIQELLRLMSNYSKP